MFKKIIGKLFNRNIAVSQVQNIQSPTPVYNNWTLKKAVAEGYKSNTWVYRSVWLIVKNLVSVPWKVKRGTEILENHHLTELFKNPNKSISENDMWELVYSWLELCGNAYLVKIKTGGKTTELWPVSPDRLTPYRSPNVEDWIHSFVLDKDNKTTKKTYLPEEVLHLKFFNPADPFQGIGPLQAVSKAVDVDNDQTDWAKSTMQNRGVVDGIFSFERPFESITDADELAESINKKYSGKHNARKLGVVGGNAKYHRTALSPIESDFSKSRKDNRDEIFIAFGIPPQLGGAQESATYNNFEVSSLIFWFSTLIPILDDVKALLNFDFRDELTNGEEIVYELSGVQAIRKAMLDRAATAEILFNMGVPFDKINRIFDFGIEEFENWDKSYINQKGDGNGGTNNEKGVDDNSNNRSSDSGHDNRFKKSNGNNNVHNKGDSTGYNGGNRSYNDDNNNGTDDNNGYNRNDNGVCKRFTLVENRTMEEDLEKTAIKYSKKIEKLLAYQKKLVFAAIEKGEGSDAPGIIAGTEDKWIETYNKIFMEIAVEYGLKVVVEKREVVDPLTESIQRYLDQEMLVLAEVSAISATTSALVVNQVREGLASGLTMSEIQQALVDTGSFSAQRALMLSRTISANAGNLGSLNGAGITGATHKTWLISSGNVRDTHKAVSNVTIPINDLFTVGGEKARFPADNRLSPEERVNCRCGLTYSIE